MAHKTRERNVSCLGRLWMTFVIRELMCNLYLSMLDDRLLPRKTDSRLHWPQRYRYISKNMGLDSGEVCWIQGTSCPGTLCELRWHP